MLASMSEGIGYGFIIFLGISLLGVLFALGGMLCLALKRPRPITAFFLGCLGLSMGVFPWLDILKVQGTLAGVWDDFGKVIMCLSVAPTLMGVATILLATRRWLARRARQEKIDFR